MEWIKASERLPDNNTMVFIRNIHSKSGGMIWHLEIPKDGLENIEWLDESTPSPSRGFTEEEMEGKIQEIGKKYFQCDCGEVYLSRKLTAPDCLYHTSCWYEALTELAASLPQSKVEGEDWVKCEEGNPLPDYDVPVLWLQENGNMAVEALDKDGNPWIFEEQKFEGTYLGNKATHWRYLPAPPKQ